MSGLALLSQQLRVLGARSLACAAPVVAARAFASYTKPVTNIPGLPAVENAREVLGALYKKTLQELEDVPASWHYRPHTESFTRWRLSMVEAEEDVREIEKKIDCGQIEELIKQAEDELEIIVLAKEERWWDDINTEELAPVKLIVNEDAMGGVPSLSRLAHRLPELEGFGPDVVDAVLDDPGSAEAQEWMAKMEKAIADAGIGPEEAAKQQ